MKKALSLFIALCLLWSCCAAEETPAVSADAPAELPSLWKAGEIHTIEKKILPLYFGSLNELWPGDFPVYFTDGADDLPWLDLRDFGELMGVFLSVKDRKGDQSDISVTVDEKLNTVTWLRRDNDRVFFSFAEQQITWPDYNGFNRRADRPYMDILQGFLTTDDDGQPRLIREGAARERLGSVVTLDLKKYGVPMLAQDGLYLVPLQTLAAFFLSPENLSIYYNKECLILTSPNEFSPMNLTVMSIASTVSETGALDSLVGSEGMNEEELHALAMELILEAMNGSDQPTLYNTYMAGPKGERSAAMTDYGLHELAMELDCLYGLKDAHDIDDFMLYFLETGLLPRLASRDPEEADGAIQELVNVWLDDGHTDFFSKSYLSENKPEETSGFSKSGRKALQASLTEIRRQALGDLVPGYTEIGDTAFVTLDNFLYYGNGIDYSTLTDDGLQFDTFGKIIYAHRQIVRDGSPIRNVVLDLSLNVGGAAPAAAYLLSWMLGDARMSVKNMFSGAETTAEYRADVNLDRVFDEQDTLSGRGLRLFCLTSPVSFSCGNLVPWAFKENGAVKLLGSITGGGSCETLPLTTAWGTSYLISGPNRLSFMKNGSYYDVDRGVEPDYVISSYDRYYDREALAEYINSLY